MIAVWYQFFVRYHNIVGLYSILGTVTFSTTISRLTHNGGSGLAQGGFYALPFKSALPATVAPNRSL
jgi:hypothetical protein